MEKQKPVKWRNVDPQVWKPTEPEDYLEGFLVNAKISDRQDTGNQYFIENISGVYFVWGTTILDDRMKLVNIGDLVRITFVELTKNKKGQDLKIFKVEVGAVSK